LFSIPKKPYGRYLYRELKKKIMNTDKLLKAIQILIKEELKEALPKLVKEAVRIETAKLLKENKNLKKQFVNTQSQPTFMDMELNENNTTNVKPQKIYTKNPILNDILNQTTPLSKTTTNESVMDRTVSFNTQTGAQLGIGGLRAQMANQMGYGDFSTGAQPGGLGVTTGNDTLDKAFNRDYSELVKRFKK
jgi:hypothetical protein